MLSSNQPIIKEIDELSQEGVLVNDKTDEEIALLASSHRALEVALVSHSQALKDAVKLNQDVAKEHKALLLSHYSSQLLLAHYSKALSDTIKSNQDLAKEYEALKSSHKVLLTSYSLALRDAEFKKERDAKVDVSGEEARLTLQLRRSDEEIYHLFSENYELSQKIDEMTATTEMFSEEVVVGNKEKTSLAAALKEAKLEIQSLREELAMAHQIIEDNGDNFDETSNRLTQANEELNAELNRVQKAAGLEIAKLQASFKSLSKTHQETIEATSTIDFAQPSMPTRVRNNSNPNHQFRMFNKLRPKVRARIQQPKEKTSGSKFI